MSILLFTDADVCAGNLAALARQKPDEVAILLHDSTGPSADLAAALRNALPEMAHVDVASDRLSRLNFDVVTLVVVDLPIEFLVASPRRRLMDVLGRLALDELALAFVGESTSITGASMLDGIHAGLGLIAGAAVIPNLAAVADLRGLIESIHAERGRLLALDGPVGVRYDTARDSNAHPGSGDRLTVAGAGSVLLVGFPAHAASSQGEERESSSAGARLHVLTEGMQAGWPA